MIDGGQNLDGSCQGHTCWDGASAQSLAGALVAPVVGCVETVVLGSLPVSARGTSSCQRLSLTVTAWSVYRQPVARVFAEALQTRLNLSVHLYERVYTALQEAMMNAMLHGNLGLESGFRNTLQGLASSSEVIEARLASDKVAHSKICIDASWLPTMLRIVVRDSGSGFDKKAVRSPDELLAAGHPGSGRGLIILNTCCDRVELLDGGATIALTFLRSDVCI